MNRVLPNACLFLLMTGGVLLFALTPNLPFTLSNGGSAQHIFAFTALSSLALFFWPNAIPQLIWSALVGFGGMIELLQGWMALGREADWGDWLVDILAVSLTMAVICGFRVINRTLREEAATLPIPEALVL